MVLAFIWWWPIGLATLLFMMWSKRMGCWNYGPRAFHQRDQSQSGQSQPGQSQQGRAPWAGWCSGRAPQSSGNHAFDEYRAETLRRLEDEQRDFVGFLDRLRYAKDKAEFDQFLADRRQRSENPAGNAPGNPPEHPDQPQSA